MRTSVELGSLAEIITGPFGSELHKSDYVTEGIPWIMPQNISERSLDYSNMAYINANDANRLKKYRVKTNDLVYARRGNVEKHAFITEQESGAICGTGCMIIRAENSNIVPAFLSFFLNRPESKRWITLHAVGSNMLNINTDILSSIPIKYPSTKEQNYIICLLQKLEDKIKINKQINDNLAA